jgi:hypothetical protein
MALGRTEDFVIGLQTGENTLAARPAKQPALALSKGPGHPERLVQPRSGRTTRRAILESRGAAPSLALCAHLSE